MEEIISLDVTDAHCRISGVNRRSW